MAKVIKFPVPATAPKSGKAALFGKFDDDYTGNFGDRMQAISRSLEEINKLMDKLKKTTREVEL